MLGIFAERGPGTEPAGDITLTLVPHPRGVAEQIGLDQEARPLERRDPLLSFEEFTAGNYTVGRGYNPATLTGDSGAGVSVELRGPRVAPFKRSRFLIQPYVFGDAAWVWNKGRGDILCGTEPRPASCKDPQHLKSAGGGLRAGLDERMAIDAAVAVPLEKAGIDHKRGSPRFLLTLTTRLLPWRS